MDARVVVFSNESKREKFKKRVREKVGVAV